MERLFIQMEPDSGPNTQYLRRGQVQFDGWNLNGIMMDLPTIVESHKTIDGKNFYKTADILYRLPSESVAISNFFLSENIKKL